MQTICECPEYFPCYAGSHQPLWTRSLSSIQRPAKESWDYKEKVKLHELAAVSISDCWHVRNVYGSNVYTEKSQVTYALMYNMQGDFSLLSTHQLLTNSLNTLVAKILWLMGEWLAPLPWMYSSRHASVSAWVVQVSWLMQCQSGLWILRNMLLITVGGLV